MEFLYKDFESFLYSYLRDGVYEKSIKYFFVYEDKILFMRKCRKFWQVICSSSCGFEPVIRFTTFDLIYQNQEFNNAKGMFFSYLYRLQQSILEK